MANRNYVCTAGSPGGIADHLAPVATPLATRVVTKKGEVLLSTPGSQVDPTTQQSVALNTPMPTSLRTLHRTE